jgi:hypothetical protein
MVGGVYLCYEGVEKFANKLMRPGSKKEKPLPEVVIANPDPDLRALEREKIKGAIRTDFILSAEIIVIALGTVTHVSFDKQVVVMIVVAVLMTFGVYGLVAGIVKLDDVGLYLRTKAGTGFPGHVRRGMGAMLLAAAPLLMKFLSVAGTLAMFMVGGGIIAHGSHRMSERIHGLAHQAGSMPVIGGLLETVMPTVLNMAVGFAAGLLALLAVRLFLRCYSWTHARLRT